MLKKVLYIFICIFLFFYGSIYAQSSWKIVYQNDRNGQPTFGKIDNLINAIHEGADVKAIILSNERFLCAQQISNIQIIDMNNEKKEVSASISNPIINKNFLLNDLIKTENFYSYLVFSTSGVVSQIYLSWYINTINKKKITHNLSIKWFIRY